LAPIIDWYSIHLYTGQADHYTTVFQSHQAERAIGICAALIERARYTQRLAHPIDIAFDEWNVWYRTRTDQDRRTGIEERYSLTDALAVAAYLHGFIRHCRVVRMANLAQLVNAIAPIFTSPQGLFLQTIYHPLRLYAEHMREIALDVHVDAPRHDLPAGLEERTFGRVHHVADLGPFSLLDAVATCDDGGRALTIGVVNRDRDRPHAATIDLGGAKATGEILVSEARRRRHELVRAPGSGRRPRAPPPRRGPPPGVRVPRPLRVRAARVPGVLSRLAACRVRCSPSAPSPRSSSSGSTSRARAPAG
jgi:alpha-L-arabinofuranosidase